MSEHTRRPNAHNTPAPRICDCTTECLQPEKHPRRLPADKYPDFQPPEMPRETGGPGALFGVLFAVFVFVMTLVEVARWAGS